MRQDLTLDKQTKQYLLDSAKTLERGQNVEGFGRYESTYRKHNAFFNKTLNVVVKKPAFIMDPRTPLFLRAPTVALEDGWFVQPILKKINLKLAVEEIEVKLEPYRRIGFTPDVHTQNVGWHEEKPLLFDW